MQLINVNIQLKKTNTTEQVSKTIQLLSVPTVGHFITLEDETVIEVMKVSHTVSDHPKVTLTCEDKTKKAPTDYSALL